MKRFGVTKIPFSTSDQWIRSLLEQANDLSFPVPREVMHGHQCFRYMLPLYHHDSLRSERAFRDEVESIIRGGGRVAHGAAFDLWASSSTARDFVRKSMKFTGLSVKLRSRDVRINTVDRFNADFVPPTSMRAAAALETLLQYGRPKVLTQSDLNKIVGSALSAYFIFLTIHPFEDGNGRTARFYFAARISKLAAVSPILLIALALMHRDRSKKFHLAAKAARVGSLDMLAEAYCESMLLASTMFAEEIDTVSRNVEAHDQASSGLLPALLAIRNRLSIYLIT